jgi:acyl-CoA thioesterase-1
MRRLASFLVVYAILAMPATSRAGAETSDACAAPEEFTTADEPLGQFAGAIEAGGPVAILAIGSATTVGTVTAGGTPKTTIQVTSFPWHMVTALHATLPNVEFPLTVHGGRGMTAEDMLLMLSAALKKQHYPLVLWQTGTVEAVRGLQPNGMSDALHAGAEMVRDAGGDLVLIDPQFSRFLRANTDLDPYEGVLQQVATLPGVVLFHRFDLMRTWANDGRIDLERTPKADRENVLDTLNVCLGQALARFVLSTADLQKK